MLGELPGGQDERLHHGVGLDQPPQVARFGEIQRVLPDFGLDVLGGFTASSICPVCRSPMHVPDRIAASGEPCGLLRACRDQIGGVVSNAAGMKSSSSTVSSAAGAVIASAGGQVFPLTKFSNQGISPTVPDRLRRIGRVMTEYL